MFEKLDFSRNNFGEDHECVQKLVDLNVNTLILQDCLLTAETIDILK